MKRGLAIRLQRLALNENVIAGGIVQEEQTRHCRSAGIFRQPCES